MTADGDDHDVDNDPLMRSMRSVWLDMRDEAPPSRGFSELMAAARVKAVEMTPEPWWRRAFASLVRPPMLAAATVVVLIGSTVVLTRRAGVDAVPSPVVETGARERPDDSKQKIARPQALEKDQFGDAEHGTDKPSIGRAVTIVGAGSAKPAPARPSRPPERKPDPAPEPMIEPPPAEPVKVTTGETGLVVKGSQDDGQGGRVGVKKPTQNTQEEAPAADAVAKPDTDRPTARPPVAGKPPETVSGPQLLKQAETAAGRKDCPAVRATVARLRQVDGKLYKDRAVTQPAIKRCL